MVEVSLEVVVSLRFIVVVELREDGECKFGDSDNGEKCLDFGYF